MDGVLGRLCIGTEFRITRSAAWRDLASQSLAAGSLAPVAEQYTLTLASIAHNTFCGHISATLRTTLSFLPLAFSLKQALSSARILASALDLAYPSNAKTHVTTPPGRLLTGTRRFWPRVRWRRRRSACNGGELHGAPWRED